MRELDAHIASVRGLGFTVIRSAAAAYLPSFERVWDAVGVAGLPGRRATTFGALREHPVTTQLLSDGVLGAVLKNLRATSLVQDELNLLDGDSHWHRDGAQVPQQGYRAVLYLDPIAVGNGALSVVPVSHLRQDQWGEAAMERLSALEGRREGISACSVAIESVPGDIVLFHGGLIHGSFGGGRRRQAAFVLVGEASSASDRLARTAFILNRMVSGTVRFE